tara:strand:+ start:199 stop:780 length:582 start_codon:yes stop_codon:yes gene_type:complete
MKELISPANLITVTGSVLTVVGCVAYLTGAANLSVPTLFYGFPIFLGGLALKTTELRPAKKIVPSTDLTKLREAAPTELSKLIKDVTRWRYGQHSHLESSLKSLKLWDQANPPQLIEIEELSEGINYGLRLKFEMAGVSLDRWQSTEERLGRFFAKGLKAEVLSKDPKEIDIILLQQNHTEETKKENGTDESK